MALEKRYGNRMLWIFTASPSACSLDMSTPTCKHRVRTAELGYSIRLQHLHCMFMVIVVI